MKKLWVVANFKSNKNIKEVLEWVDEVGPKLPREEGLRVVVCPTFSALAETRKAVQVGNYPLLVGSQDLSPFGMGAYTGEEPGEVLKMFVQVSIIGHSERRQNFNETDEMVSEKVIRALENQITPLVCVQGVETPVPEGCKVVAYEPVFAIGTGTPDTPLNANSVAKSIKQTYGDVGVLYGGSVNVENCKMFVSEENIEGLLIGKSSLNASDFVRIVSECVI